MPGRRRLRLWLIGLLPVLVVGVLAGTRAVRERAAQPRQDRPGTVLLVAGYGGAAGSLDVLAGRLRAAGRSVRVLPPVGDNTGDLTAQARELQRAAAQAVSPAAPAVDVVGYSAGGIVARLWVTRLDGARLARRVVTIGSPHRGTELAGLAAGLGGCPIACRQLAPGSELLDDLPALPSGQRWTSIWTADDQTVLPPSSAVLPGALNVELQQVCPGARVSHGELPAAPLVAGLVEAALDGPGLAAAPPPSRCAQLGG